VASKLHGRTLTAKQLIASGVTSFTALDVAKMELVICMNLNWRVSPVTSYDIMKHLLLYSAAGGETLKNLILHAQIFIDYAMCEYATMKFSPAAVAMSGVLQAHKAANHCPKQWLTAVQEINLYPAEDEDVKACCCTMRHLFEFAGIDLPPKSPTKSAASTPRQNTMVSPTSVALFPPSSSPSPQGPQAKRQIAPKKREVGDKVAPCGRGSLKRAPIKFHCSPEESGPPLKRPRAISITKSPVE
jgi:hypothetical protein